MNEETRKFLFRGKQDFLSPSVQCSFKATSDFHDAFLTDVYTIDHDVVLSLAKPFFPKFGRYGFHNLVGAKIQLRLRKPIDPFLKTQLAEANGSDVYWLRFDNLDGKFQMSVEGQEYLDLEFEFSPTDSYFEWQYAANPSVCQQ